MISRLSERGHGEAGIFLDLLSTGEVACMSRAVDRNQVGGLFRVENSIKLAGSER